MSDDAEHPLTTTIIGENSYPQYARPDNGRTFEKNGFVYDNRWVIPYNPYLSEKEVIY